MTQPVLRLIADDLTGALDTAAEFAALCGPVAVRRDVPGHAAGSLAIATASREASREAARSRVAAAAQLLAGADIAFKKLDSLLRGHPMAELAACIATGAWRHVVLAPAFPAQARVTRGGRQFARQGDAWQPVAEALPRLLAAEGLAAVAGDPAAALPPGVSVFDAATEDDLRRVVACGRSASGRVLWCGSGGLGRALAEDAPTSADTTLRGPVLGLFGSDQAVTRRQLAACGDAWIELGESETAMPVRGAALYSIALPEGVARGDAAHRIAQAFARLLASIPRPGTLIVAGGETLGAVCDALGANGLAATGLVGPGVPRSVLLGGRWDGVAVVSKSGAFGGDGLWRDLLARNGFITERQSA
ncbi:four-carbon acid sugar kinase family protein [Neoroseomonas oryzicola]|uniref:Hrp-dependent type III effector protein n=1 Tax=Neoroseomonas oryzicola TaxID=535904 RepID=A0A9X9WFH8_9PROT|nr:four-carbon acid sugar kinase family protein [Neoroseomonas oryzicola]MBR0659088.1 Hrp-dependent type III effector protein [Neoroseomonas oryzicola]NKE17025.1 Hrp-dependent type III effector protein [Neoroseomonas oryzicola]